MIGELLRYIYREASCRRSSGDVCSVLCTGHGSTFCIARVADLRKNMLEAFLLDAQFTGGRRSYIGG